MRKRNREEERKRERVRKKKKEWKRNSLRKQGRELENGKIRGGSLSMCRRLRQTASFVTRWPPYQATPIHSACSRSPSTTTDSRAISGGFEYTGKFKTQRVGKRSPASRSNYDTPPGNLASRGQPASENNFDVAFDPLLSLFELLDAAIQKWNPRYIVSLWLRCFRYLSETIGVDV